MNQFFGAWTALVTPFQDDQSIDYDVLAQLIEHQISGNIDGILLLGTTAETPTLTDDEKKKIVDFSIERIAHRCKVMVNVGTNCTRDSLENIKYFNSVQGIDAYLIVNPYYNKPTQTGLFEHFRTLAHATDRPVFLYNIKGRTGVNLETHTLLELLEICPNIIGVKEASGDIAQIKEVIQKTEARCTIFSGDDALTGEIIHSGGHGVISVASNLFPKEVSGLVHAGLKKDFPQMQAQHEILLSFFEGQFIQTNPLPIKTALEWSGFGKAIFRLPLCPMDDVERNQWQDIYKTTLGILKS